MKNIYITLFILLLSLKGYGQSATADATLTIGYWKIKDGTMLANSIQLIKQLKSSVEASASIYNSAASLGDLYKQIQDEDINFEDLEKYRFSYFDEHLEKYMKGLENKYVDAPFIDFYEVYMNETNKFRNSDGSIDLFQFGAYQISNTSSFSNVISDISYQSNNLSNQDDGRDRFIKDLLKSRTFAKVARHSDIRRAQLNIARHNKNALLLHVKINKAILGLTPLKEGSVVDKMKFKRTLVLSFQREQELHLDSAAREKLRLERLINTPVELPEAFAVIIPKIDSTIAAKAFVMEKQSVTLPIRDVKARWN